MMEFGELERRMLQDLVLLHKSQNLCIYSWLSKLFDDKVTFKWVPDSHQWNYRIEINSNELGKNEILPKIKYFYFLYKRLEKTNLIDLDLSISITINFKAFDTHEFSLCVSTEPILYNFLSMWGYKPILVSHYIIDLVANDFKSPEQRQFEKQLEVTIANHNVAMDKAQKQINIAWGAFVVSLIALIITSTLGILQKCSDTTINQSQLNQIKQTIEQKTLPEVIKTEITNDTLTTKVVEMPKVKLNKQNGTLE